VISQTDIIQAADTKNETLDRAVRLIFQQLNAGQISLEEAEKRLLDAAEVSTLPLPEILAALRVARPPVSPSPSTIIDATPDEENTSPGAAFLPPTPGRLPPPPLEALPQTAQNLLLESARVFGDLPLEVPMVSFLAFLSGCV